MSKRRGPIADRHLIDVHLLIVRDDDIPLTRRRDANPLFDGLWHLPSGKLDAGESVLNAAVREANEEVGLHLDPVDLRLVHTLHVNGSGPEPRLGLFFETRRWAGTPINREPDGSLLQQSGWLHALSMVRSIAGRG